MPTLRIFPEMVPLPPPGFPRIKAKCPSSSGAAADIDDMKLRSFDAEENLLIFCRLRIILEPFSARRAKLAEAQEYMVTICRCVVASEGRCSEQE